MHPGFIDKILSPEQWRKRTQTSQPSLSQYLRKKQRSAREPKWCHKPQDEKLPDHVFFTLDTKEMDAQMEGRAVKVITFLRGQAYENIDEISALRKKMVQLELGPEKPDWSYALVGEHGGGKSTLTNCLLGRHDLAGAAKSTKSCTQFATEFRYKMGAPDDTEISDVTIAFFDDLKLKDITEENVMRYGHVHHRKDEEEEEDNDDASLQPALTRTVTAYDENLSTEAYKFFSLIVKGNKQAEKELEKHLKSSKSFTDGSLVEFLLRKQREHFDALGVDDNKTITYHNVPDKLGPGSEPGALDIAAVRKKAESLFSLVRLVTVATGGMLLRYGLVFVDIPGYGDLNQARIASANVHRRGAHGEIIVGAAPRIEDSKELDGQVDRSRKAHGDRNTVLVMNQIDKAYDMPDLDAVWHKIEENKDPAFSDLLIVTENDPDAEEAYFDYVTETAQCAMVRQSAEPTEDVLKQRHGGRINVFSVVASDAHDWLDNYRLEDPTWGPYMSGVPHLRQGLLSLTAEQKLQIYHKHYFQVLPSIVDDVHRILTKSSAKTEALLQTRCSLEQCFRNAIRDSRAAKDINSICIILPIYTGPEKITVTERIKALIQVWSDSTVVLFNTFMHTLVCKGIPTRYVSTAYRGREINWNRDLLETMERPANKSHAFISEKAHLSDWKVAMKDKSAKVSNSITGPITTLWALVEDIIVSSSVPPVLKSLTRSAWKKVENSIRDMINRFPEQITSAIDKSYTDVTTEEDIGCMIAQMNVQAYEDAEFQRRGQRVYTRQRQSLIKSLCTPDSDGRSFVDRFEISAKQKMNDRIAQVSEAFIAAVDSKLKEFICITEQFIETDVYNTTQHIAVRKFLQNWLPEFQTGLLDCQRQFPGQQDQEDVQFMGSIKRVRAAEREEPLIKKIKTEDDGENGEGTADSGTTDGKKSARSCDHGTTSSGSDDKPATHP